MFELENYIIDNSPYLYKPIKNGELLYTCNLNNFDREGYELLPIEQQFYKDNEYELYHLNVLPKESDPSSGGWKAPVQNWFYQKYEHENIFLDHSFLLRRHGYANPALLQLKDAATERFELMKLVATKPMWGFDFCVDWSNGDEMMEIIHAEWDFYDFDEFLNYKDHLEKKILSMDFIHIAKYLLNNKEKWYKLDSDSQGDYKAKLFDLPQAMRILKCI